MEECNRCKSAGFPGQSIDFEKIGQDPATGKNLWKLLNKDRTEHEHKHRSQQQQEQRQDGIRICRYCNQYITFHDHIKAPSGKMIPLNRDNTIHDCMLNPYNLARKEDHEMKKVKD
jgi:hypothetical protein